jgi:hypothetical protein
MLWDESEDSLELDEEEDDEEEEEEEDELLELLSFS